MAKKINRVLIMRTCDKNLRSRGGFQWPASGRVESPDWKSTKTCGSGLHGFLRGEGQGNLADWRKDAKWIAAWVDADRVIELDGKVKFPWAEVAKVGTLAQVIEFMRENGCDGPVIGATVRAGVKKMAVAGDYGTAIAGDFGSALASDDGKAFAGEYGYAHSGKRGKSFVKYGGSARAGYCGTAVAGDYGTARAGQCGTARAGDYGAAEVGDSGAASAGHGGVLKISYDDRKRLRVAVLYVGENGIKPNVLYRVGNDGKPQEVK